MKLSIFVPGEIVATARARVNQGHVTTPRRTVEYQSKVARAVRAAMARVDWPESFEGRVAVRVELVGERFDFDADNAAKGALDGLVKARALRDDRLRYVRELVVVAVEDRDVVGMRIDVRMLDEGPQGRASEARC